MVTAPMELVEDYAKTQSAEAFAQLVDAYRDVVYGVCLRILRNPADADDVTQECFLALARKAGEIRSSVGGWLHAKATTLSLTRLERERNRRVREERYSAQRGEPAGEATWEQIGPEVDRALAELPEDVRDVLVGHFLEHKLQAQIAEELKVSAPTVSRRIASGLEQLRAKLAERGVLASAGVLGPMLLEKSVTQAPAHLAAELGKMAMAGVGKTAAGSATPAIAASVVAVLIAVGAVIWGMRDSGRTAMSPATGQARSVVMDQSSKVLQGVPRVGYDVRLCPFPGSVEACLTYRGEQVDFDYVAAVSGAAFRRFYNRNDGGNVDLMYLGEEVWERTFSALGYEYQHVSPYDRPALVKAMRASIDANRPVITFGIIGPPEAGVIAGYEKDGEVLVGWSYFQENKGDYYHQANWKSCEKEGLGFVVIGDKKASKPTDREVLVSTLSMAIDLARRPKRLDHPGHVSGLAAYEAWAKDWEDDAFFPAGNKEELGMRGMIIGDQSCMLMDRRAAVTFLRQMAEVTPEAREPLEAAAGLYENAVAVEPEINRGGAAYDAKRMVDHDLRMQIAVAIRRAGELEAQAVTELERALAILSPVPAKAELMTPRPEELTVAGRRAPEDMGIAIVMRACGDLLRINPSGYAANVTPDNWRVDANQTLMMAVTGQSFEWEWLSKPGQKPDRGWEYYLDEPAKAMTRALWAMGLDGEVIVFPKWDARGRQVSEEEIQQQIAYSMHHRQLPAILLGEGNVGECFLVTGYEQGGKVLSGWKTGGGGPSIVFEPQKRVAISDWYKDTRGVILLKGRVSRPTPQKLYRQTLADAVTSMKRMEAGPYYGGQAMHEAWCKAIVDPTMDEGDAATAQKRAGLIDPLIWDLAERRWYGSMFLKNAAKVFPAAGEELTGAAADFLAIHGLMYSIMKTGGGTSPGGPVPQLGDANVRQEMAELMKQAAQRDANARTKIEAALKKM